MMISSNHTKTIAKTKSGLVLLVVLGMLGLFSLLAITYLSISGSSRTSSQSLVRAKLQNIPIADYSAEVIRQLNRGTTDRRSAFANHGMLEDIYGRNPIEGSFQVASAALNSTASTIGIAKVQLTSGVQVNPDPFRTTTQENASNITSRDAFLSAQKDTYAGRLITFLEGPLKNQTFRILAYAGTPVLDGGGVAVPGMDYAIAIDLNETKSDRVPVYIQGAPNGELASVQSIINVYGVAALFESYPGNTSSAGYRYVMNDVPFNGFGYGVDRATNQNDFGNLGQSRLVPDPFNLLASSNVPVQLPLALLPHYDYLLDAPAGVFDTGTIGWLYDPPYPPGVGTPIEVIGSNNEGFDVPDYRDMWLSFVPEGGLANNGSGAFQALPSTAEIIPAFHRPEVVNYIVQSFEKLRTATSTTYSSSDLARMVQLIDYACPRPLAYRLRGVPNVPSGEIVRNLDFTGRNDVHAIGVLDADVSNVAAALPLIKAWAARLIGQGVIATELAHWDVDNDGDGIADSVWVDPNLPLVSAPNGKQLKVLAAPLVLDMDGRVNVYASGDGIQANQLNPVTGNSYETLFQAGAETAFARTTSFLPQGLGFGPADISMASFFSNGSSTQNALNLQKLFGFRYGYDGGAGRSTLGGASIDDTVGRYFQQRGLWESPTNQTIHRGLQLARRGQIAYGIDRFGNPRMSDSRQNVARTYFSTNTANDYPETKDDPYETSPYGVSAGDSKIALGEMEAVLRRFDQDVSALPNRVRELVNKDLGATNLNAAIYSSIASLSSELRYPNMAAIARHNRNYVTPFNASTTLFPRSNNPTFPTNPTAATNAVPADTTGARLVSNQGIEASMIRWVQLMHQERFQTAAPLTTEDVRNLFPLEFRKGLKLDINRAFGNGIDSDGDGQIDEPQELSNFANTPQELEYYPSPAVSATGQYGFNYPNYAVSGTGLTAQEYTTYYQANQSRKLFARQLYCLAQLLITPDYPFGGVAGTLPLDPRYPAKRARELAQWAVNVVDFRDTDGAMTRFEYDETPFVIDAGDSVVWAPKVGNVVWGMEFPDLLLTESLAFHDKRIRDTNKDSTGQKIGATDMDMDQYRIPQGSLFLELFCPRTTEVLNVTTNPNQSVALPPTGLYTFDGTQMRLQLDKLAPADAANVYGSQPVFRIGITQQQLPGTGPATVLATHNQEALFATTNQTSVYDKTNAAGANNAFTSSGLLSDLNGTVANQIEFDRIVWFSNLSGNNATIRQVPDLSNPLDPNRANRVFYNKAGAAVSMLGGDYLVVGPRQKTYIGAKVPADENLPVHSPSIQSITFGATGIDIGDFPLGGNNRNPPPSVIARPPLTMIAVAEAPNSTWTAAPNGYLSTHQGVGLNISEPLQTATTSYYPMPNSRLNSTDNAGDGTVGVTGFQTMPFDSYFSYQPVTTPLVSIDVPFDYDQTRNPVLANPAAPRNVTGTYANERTAYLQRIADPELPYHPTLNPYVTVDWISLDLTVFNGEDVRTTDPQESPGTPTIAFQSRYKDGCRADETPSNAGIVTALTSGRGINSTNRTGVSLFSASTGELVQSQPIAPTVVSPGVAGQVYFPYELGIRDPASKAAYNQSSVTLGYLNTGRQIGPNFATDWDGFGYPQTNTTFVYQGSALQTLAGMFHFNRSFASPAELMLVPRTAPGQLAQSMTFPTAGGAATNRYSLTTAIVPGALPSPYGYLPAFFASDTFKTVQPGSPPTPRIPFWQQSDPTVRPQGANWSSLLELIETAPPYADSQRWLDPTMFSATGNTAVDNIRTYLLGDYAAPFNAMSDYRTPGKINLNTISRREVWDALEWNYNVGARNSATSMANSSTGNGAWERWKASRRGYRLNAANTPTSPTDNFFQGLQWAFNPFLSGDYPTQFVGAVRPSFSKNIDVANVPGVGGFAMRDGRGIQSTIYRSATNVTPELIQNLSNPLVNHPFGNSPDPNPVATITPDTQNMLLQAIDTGATGAAEEMASTPFANYQRAMRLPNLTTNQSNVFAVWITIGLFEYDPDEGIGREYIGPSGIPERSKSFYVVDRSIPVGFAPGKQYNTDKTILLRRKVSSN